MDQTAEEKMVRERIRKRVNEVSSVSQSLLSPVQDHINFTLQKAYFKCAYECFDRTRTHSEISRCAESCSVPITNAQNHFDNEMSVFQERLNRSLVVCQDKFEAAKLQKTRTEAVNGLEQCVNQTVDEAVKTLPNLVERMKKALSITDLSPP
ncbi:PREDICTED: protein FAM136A-like [Camelina sativa]|uniref:Protein FAM136A-like n=1 Tax=Camelina sativa TaxID=90675 RepID=A0ABM0YUZ8_CAMSA|nr:PREDICTED: protein FAM136A-like [Camelina sativa]